jgi:putative peptidoglycan lipid II flippase
MTAGGVANAPEGTGSVAGNTATVAGWTLVSRATGFLRVVTIAAVLGPTYFGNTFQSMNLLPNATYELLAGGLISAIIIPAMVRHVDLGDRASAERVAGGFMGVLLAIFATVAVLLTLLGPLVARLFVVGVTDEAAIALQQRAGWLLIALVVPQLLFYGIAGTGAAVQNAHGRFALAAGVPVIENLGVVLTLVLSAVFFGTGRDLAEVTTAQIVMLGAGSTISVAVHAAAQWWGALRCGVKLVPRAGWRDPEVRRLSRLARPSLGIASLLGVRYVGILIVASSVPGGVVAFTMAVNFFNLPVALGAKPVAAALLPRLSRLAADRLRRFSDEWANGMGLAFFVTVPAAVAFLALSWPLASAAAFGEMATEDGIRLIAVSLAAVSLGVLGETAFTVGTPASFALGDARSPLRAMVLRTVVNVPGMVLSVLLFEGLWVVLALGVTLSVGDLVAGGVLWVHLSRRLPAGERSAATSLIRSAVAAVVMILPALAVVHLLPRIGTGHTADISVVLIAGLVSAVAYLGVQRAFGAPELAALGRRNGFGGAA